MAYDDYPDGQPVIHHHWLPDPCREALDVLLDAHIDLELQIADAADSARAGPVTLALAAARRHEGLSTYTLSTLVIYAKNSGLTWARIGQALGLTPQAVWERFREIAHQEH